MKYIQFHKNISNDWSFGIGISYDTMLRPVQCYLYINLFKLNIYIGKLE